MLKSERREAKREREIRGHKTGSRSVQLIARLQQERADGLRAASTPGMKNRGRKKRRSR